MGPTETKIQNIDFSPLSPIKETNKFIAFLTKITGYDFGDSKKKLEMLQLFASKNNFKYDEELSSFNEPGTIFNYGYSRSVLRLISGKLGDYTFHDGELRYVEENNSYASSSGISIILGGLRVGSSSSGLFGNNYGLNSRRTEHIRYIDFTSIDLPRKLPQMILNSKKQSALSGFMFKKSQQISLEGDFDKYFKLYVPDKMEVTALSFLTPDVMEFFIQNLATCDFEIVDNKLYLYWTHEAVNSTIYKNRFTVVAKLLDQIGRKLTTGNILNDSSSDSSKSKQSSNSSEPARLKKNYVPFIIIFAIALIVFVLRLVYSF